MGVNQQEIAETSRIAPSNQPSEAKRSAAIFSVFAAGCVTLLKFLTGILTGSLGMLSEAAHSGIDLIASAITLFSVHVSDRPADEDHNYGRQGRVALRIRRDVHHARLLRLDRL